MARPQVRRRRRQHQRSEHRRAWWIIGLATVVLVGVLSAAVMFQPAKLGANGCPLDNHRAPVAKTVIMIDQTDALPPTELAYVRRLVKNEYAWLPKQGALNIRLISGEAPDGVSALTACRMSDGSDALGIIDNPVAMHKDYERKVGAALNTFLDGMASQPEQAQSPILEAVTAAMNDPEFAPDIATRRLVIVSDMAQNTPAFTQYGRKRPATALPATAAGTFAAKFTGTAVRVQYIRRPKLAWQGVAHQAFWRRYFTQRGASDVAIGHELALGEPSGRQIWYDAEPATPAKPAAQ